jgi:hypothetical protein
MYGWIVNTTTRAKQNHRFLLHEFSFYMGQRAKNSVFALSSFFKQQKRAKLLVFAP